MPTEPLGTISERRLLVNQTVPRGRVVLRRVSGALPLRYYLFWPARVVAGQPLLVAVHGISLNGREQARAFAEQSASDGAAGYGSVIVAPLFEPENYPDYQRLGRVGRGGRADLTLQAILADVAALTGRPQAPVNLFGFSGGGQFCHRFTMAHPELVHRQVLAAPGWYTLPTARHGYPLGLALKDELPGVEFEPTAFLRVPTSVLVGTHDTQRDEALRTGRRIDRLQGRDRVARGRKFIKRLRSAAARYGLSTSFEFATLPHCGHDFGQCVHRGGLAGHALSFLYPTQQPPVETQ